MMDKDDTRSGKSVRYSTFCKFLSRLADAPERTLIEVGAGDHAIRGENHSESSLPHPVPRANTTSVRHTDIVISLITPLARLRASWSVQRKLWSAVHANGRDNTLCKSFAMNTFDTTVYGQESS